MKLNYEELKIEDIVFYVAHSRCRTMHINVKPDGKVYAVCPKYISDREFIEFLTSKIEWVKKSKEKVSEMHKDRPDRMTLKELKEKIIFYVSKYQPLMQVSIKRISFRKMKTMWGSCTKTKRTIRFSTMLIKCNDEFIEYVVVHEMAHLIEANHSKRFWNIVGMYIPDYKIRKKRNYN